MGYANIRSDTKSQKVLLHPHSGYRNLVVELVASQTNKKVVLPCTGNDLPSISTMGQFPKYSVNI